MTTTIHEADGRRNATVDKIDVRHIVVPENFGAEMAPVLITDSVDRALRDAVSMLQHTYGPITVVRYQDAIIEGGRKFSNGTLVLVANETARVLAILTTSEFLAHETRIALAMMDALRGKFIDITTGIEGHPGQIAITFSNGRPGTRTHDRVAFTPDEFRKIASVLPEISDEYMRESATALASV